MTGVLWFCIVCSCFSVLMFHVQSSIELLYAINHLLLLIISEPHVITCCVDVSQEDSGNYTCEVRGPQSTLLGHVTHYLFVRGTTIVITSHDDTEMRGVKHIVSLFDAVTVSNVSTECMHCVWTSSTQHPLRPSVEKSARQQPVTEHVVPGPRTAMSTTRCRCVFSLWVTPSTSTYAMTDLLTQTVFFFHEVCRHRVPPQKGDTIRQWLGGPQAWPRGGTCPPASRNEFLCINS